MNSRFTMIGKRERKNGCFGKNNMHAKKKTNSTYNSNIETILDSILLVASLVFLVLYVVHLYRNNWNFLIQNKKKNTPKLQVSVTLTFKHNLKETFKNKNEITELHSINDVCLIGNSCCDDRMFLCYPNWFRSNTGRSRDCSQVTPS